MKRSKPEESDPIGALMFAGLMLAGTLILPTVANPGLGRWYIPLCATAGLVGFGGELLRRLRTSSARGSRRQSWATAGGSVGLAGFIVFGSLDPSLAGSLVAAILSLGFGAALAIPALAVATTLRRRS